MSTNDEKPACGGPDLDVAENEDVGASAPPNNDQPQQKLENVLTAINSTRSMSRTDSNGVDLENGTSQPPNQFNSSDDPNIVYWDSSDDRENPMNWPTKLKLTNVALVSTWTLLTPLASSMVAPGTLNILTDFHVSSTTLGSFVVSIYVLGYALGPLLVAPMSEIYGRLPVYHTCNGMFVAWTLACAFAPDIGALLAFRFFQGAVGVCPLTIGSGTISDLIPSEARGKFMAVYSIGPLLGPGKSQCWKNEDPMLTTYSHWSNRRRISCAGRGVAMGF